MKTAKWTISKDDITQKKTEQFYYLYRVKMMLTEFYIDVQKESLSTDEEVKQFIEEWVKYHFQY
jgi:hypothetical protein